MHSRKRIRSVDVFDEETGGQIVPDPAVVEIFNQTAAIHESPILALDILISNKEAILADAQQKADQIIAQAQIQTNELVSEHQIMQQAYAQANEVVMIATKQAQEILDNATNEANNIRLYAMSYTDDKLKALEDILTNSIDTTKARTENLVSSLQGYLDIVSANRAELFPPEPEPAPAKKPVEKKNVDKNDPDGLDAIDLSVINIKGDE